MKKQSKPRKSKVRSSTYHTDCVQALEGRTMMSVTAPTMYPSFAAGKVGNLTAATSFPSPPTAAIFPSEMRAYYGIDNIQFGNVPGDGRGMTIAIVDAFDQPNLQSDVNAFNAQFNLPTLTINKYNQNGLTAPLAPTAAVGNWGIETTLDVEWAHVIAPLANIVVVEGNTSGGNDLFNAATSAASLPNVAVVSMSFGSPEFSGENTWDSNFTTPFSHTNVTFIAATGDKGSSATTYPAFSPNVVAVGGTTFTFDANSNITGETGWSGSGGGTSAYESQPTFQNGFQSTGLRTTPDVSMDGDPGTGVPIYDAYDFGTTYPWGMYGGTSLAAPMFGGVIAIADQGRIAHSQSRLDGTTQTLPMLYGLNSGDYHDVLSGSNGGFTATAGYDEVTGLGTPLGNLMPNHLAGIAPSAPTINDSISGDTITLTEDANKLYIDWTAGGINGQFTNTNRSGLKLTGTGNSTIQFNYTNGNPVPAILSLSGTFTLNGLQGTNPLAGAKWNINSSTLFMTYSTASDPITAVQAYLKSGFNGGAWNGNAAAGSGSIVSSTAAADSAHLHAIGYIDSADGKGFNTRANSIEIKYTLYGDTALVGSVGFTDFMRMTQHNSTTTGGTWDSGDFNFDGAINSSDFNLLQPAYGLNLTTSPAAAPALTPAAATATPSSSSTSATPTSATVTPTPSTSTASKKAADKHALRKKRAPLMSGDHQAALAK